VDERWQQIERIYHAVRELDGSARAEFLAKACAGDPALRDEVESLLVQADQHDSFLQSPAIEVEAEAFAKEKQFSDPPKPGLELGAMIAHCRLVEKLGEGGMGEVYRARDTKLQRDVALKILPETMAHDARRMARFEREAQVLASLNHPNIAAIHGIEESNGIRALVMELVEGETLAERISVAAVSPPPGGFPKRKAAGEDTGATTGDRRSTMTPDDALPIAKQIADALEYAHERGVIHRDLKPANIKITPEGTVKVLDFGLAKILTPQDPTAAVDSSKSPTISAMATQPGAILGTAPYMSPEQAKGQRVDRRCDIWAFGCVLFEMLSGQTAFDGETISDVLAAVLTKQPDWSALPKSTPVGIQQLIRRCLQKDLRQRLQAIGDARIVIEETLSGSPSLTSPLPPAEGGPGDRDRDRVREPLQHDASDSQIIAALVKRHKGKLALAGALLAAFVMVGGYAIYRLPRSAAPQQAATPASPANMQITQLTTSGTVILAAISPDGRYVAYAQQGGKGQGLWLRQVATGSAVEIVPPAGVQYVGLTFSPDGNYLDYVQAPQGGTQLPTLYQAPVLGGQTHKLLENVVSAVTFSPDGKRIAFVRGLAGTETQVVVANSDGSGERVLASKRFPHMFLPALNYGRPAWSPDGRIIAVSAGTFSPYETHPAVFDVRTGREQRIGSRQWIHLDQLAWQPEGKGLLLEASDASTPRNQIWRLSYPGGKLNRITNDLNDYRGVSVTADGAALATVQTRAASNIWAAPKGEWDRPRQITQGLSNADGMDGVAWTAGGKIVYSSMANEVSSLWLADPASGQANNLIQKGIADFRPSACGKAGLIVFVAAVKSASGAVVQAIWRTNADGSGLEQLTPGGFDTEPSCSPDGRWVIYASASHGNSRLSKVPSNGGKPVQLTEEGASWVPTISPDGKWILYYHSTGARSPWKFTIRPFAGGKAVRTFTAPFVHLGGSPISVAWMPNSRAFAYIKQKGGVSNIVEQPIAGGSPKQLTHYDSGRIFGLDVSRDGKLALARGTESSDVVLIKGFQ
jgi:serine/threonine protein kinase/Tol biopolymer transport system component